MQLKKSIRFVLRICFLILFMSGCGGGRENVDTADESLAVTTLHLAIDGRDTNWISSIETFANRFMLEYPQIDIQLSISTDGSYTEFLNASYATDSFPDVMEIVHPVEYVRSDKLGGWPDSLSGRLADPYIEDGICRALPICSSINGIIYNKTIFDTLGLKAPGSYQEFLEICEILKENGYTPIAFAGNDEDSFSAWSQYFFSLVLSDQPDWLNRRILGKTSFTDPVIIRMLKRYRDLFDRGYITDSYSELHEKQLPTLLANEKAVMLYSVPGTFDLLTHLDPDFQFGWFYMPDLLGIPSTVNSIISYWCMSRECAEDPDRYEAAILFLDRFYQKDFYRQILQKNSTFSTTSQVVLYPSLEITQSLKSEYIYANVKSAYLGDLNTPPTFNSAYTEILKLLVSGVYTEAEAASQMDYYWNAYAEIHT